MKIFAAALNLAVFTSAASLTSQTATHTALQTAVEASVATEFVVKGVDRTSDGYKAVAGQIGAVYDSSLGGESLGNKMNSDLGLPKAIAKNLGKALNSYADTNQNLTSDQIRGQFIDTIFGLYILKNVNDKAGVAAGTAPFEMENVTMADVAKLTSCPDLSKPENC